MTGLAFPVEPWRHVWFVCSAFSFQNSWLKWFVGLQIERLVMFGFEEWHFMKTVGCHLNDDGKRV
jgi:hypothetical protein